MIYPLVSNGHTITPMSLRIQNSPPGVGFCLTRPIHCSQHQNPKSNIIDKPLKPRTHLVKPITITPDGVSPVKAERVCEERRGSSQVGIRQMMVFCGFGYWVQGFRGFPWLALNFHMAHNLNLRPSTLQLVQNTGNLPMVIKPLYGILSDALYIGGAHRIPYICIGVFLQVFSWGPLALIPFASESLPTLMACILLSNLGASITEVSKDALVAEYGQRHKMSGLQSYAFMALAAGGVLGNLLGGFFLLKTQQPKSMFLVFTALLAVQLAISLGTRESLLGLPQPSSHSLVKISVSDSIRKQYSDLKMAITEDNISRPLLWIVASVAMVPILSGSIFCYQTHCLDLDPSIIGMSKVTGQLMLLSITVLYDRIWKRMSMRKLIGTVQILYAASLLLDLVLVKQINLKMGFPNEVFALCFSGIAETISQFKLLPFLVLFANLAPPGCEGSLTSFLASALCLASIVSGLLGVGLASHLGITSGNYSSLPVGILIQFLAALVPLTWIYHVPSSQPMSVKEKKRGRSKRTRRNRRVGKIVLGSIYAYRRERESEAQKN
ncbi:probable folate-biopterin transporter 9, chloroplastic [Diospyros lotus]|uniref:probable folate-biopterin transporter 9, chloroplastic n=1 Tax=Diospyros lotus TaxID=55363 RepID=UPI002258D77E|nr:probable folate-biopterin transporter 9, chloroplastic [Diospyros lotus]